MKIGIHPKYYNDVNVSCTCGNTFTTGSTKPSIKVDICSKCHPFFTGQIKFVDTVGRIERFQKKLADQKANPFKKKDKENVNEAPRPRSLREMLLSEQPKNK